MDYRNIKELVINKRWGNDGRYGDEYRSLSKQVDNFIIHLKREDSPLQWLPLELMTDNEISDILIAYLDRSNDNRLLLNNLDFEGMKYDYSDFIVPDYDRQKEMEMVLDTLPELKGYKKLKIKVLLPEINIMLVGGVYNGYTNAAKELLRILDTVRIEIADEKSLFKCIGLSFTNTGYIEEYIRVCERIAIGSLFYFLVDNKNVTDKKEALLRFREKLEQAYLIIEKEMDVAKANLKRVREFHKEYHKAQPNDAADISIYYVQFLERKSYYDELDKIVKSLEREVKENAELFYDRRSDSNTEENEHTSQEYICEGIDVSDFDRKYCESKKIIDLSRDFGSVWASKENEFDVKVVFREFFMSKVKYNRRTAMSIVRNILSENIPTNQELMFLDKKLLRGYFREQGLMDEYPIFNRICSKIRRMFLKCYSAIDDEEAYRLIHRACYEVLYLFLNTEYSGIITE